MHEEVPAQQRHFAGGGGPAAHPNPPIASVFTMAPGKTWQEFLASIRRGECLSWGSEMGFTNVLGDVYRSIGKHYREVTKLRNPEYSTRERAQHLFFSIASLPIFAAGFPAAVLSLNYAKQVALSKNLTRRFARKGLSRPRET